MRPNHKLNKALMAIYHYHRGIGKRANGKNAVLAVAYIRAEKRKCPRTEDEKDFTYKQDVVFKNTFLPEGAPQWAQDLRHSQTVDSTGKKHEDLEGTQFSTYAWGQIEFSEKRSDSQVYFHDDMALPNSLSQEQAIGLTTRFVQSTLAINGVFCDVAIHWDEGNHHVHVMMPHRPLTDTGFGKKIRRGRGGLKAEVKRVREAWGMAVNQKLQEVGSPERVDHRSYKDRGIDLVPTVKIGKSSHFSDDTIAIQKAEENELIKNRNAQAIKNGPDILAKKIVQEQTFFTEDTIHHEIGRYVAAGVALEAAPKIEGTACPVLAKLLVSIQTEEGIFNERSLKTKILAEVEGAQNLSAFIMPSFPMNMY